MTTIRVEKKYEKEITWMGCPKCKKKVCEHNLPKQQLKSIAYTALSNGIYYKLKGWGANMVEEGQEISGAESEEEYTTKEGEKRVSKVLTMSKPLSIVIEDVYKIVQPLNAEDWARVIEEISPKFAKEESDEISVEDIPF